VHGTHTGVDGFAAPADEHQESVIGETGIRPAHRAVRAPDGQVYRQSDLVVPGAAKTWKDPLPQ
jgi:hypothetical protein